LAQQLYEFEDQIGETKMKVRLSLIALLVTLFSVPALATTKSDYDHRFDFSKLQTWDFKVQNRMPRDPVGTVLVQREME
jgi:hypothetical protein